MATWLLVACNKVEETSTPTDPSPTNGTAWPYPEPADELAADPACEDFQGTPIPGATGFFVGDFDFVGDDGAEVVGYEAWLLFANSEWQATGVDDTCSIVWSATGTRDPGGDAQLYSLVLHFEVDRASSACDPELLEITASDVPQFDVAYEVAVDDEGAATFQLGSVTGHGWGTAERATYHTDGACTWF